MIALLKQHYNDRVHEQVFIVNYNKLVHNVIPEPNDSGIMPNIGKMPFKTHEQISHQPLLMAIGMVHNIEKKTFSYKNWNFNAQK